MSADRSPDTLLPLAHHTVLILLALAEGPRHGYGIIRDINDRSQGAISLQTGALYRELKHLLAERIIEECAPPRAALPDGDPRRRYYKTTRFGGRVLAAEVERMSTLVRAAQAIIAGRRPRFA